MIRIQCLRTYTRELLHALRNGLDILAATGQATQRTKEYYANEKKIETGIPPEDALLSEEWHAILVVLVEFSILLAALPVDLSKLPQDKWEFFQAQAEGFEKRIADRIAATTQSVGQDNPQSS